MICAVKRGGVSLGHWPTSCEKKKWALTEYIHTILYWSKKQKVMTRFCWPAVTYSLTSVLLPCSVNSSVPAETTHCRRLTCPTRFRSPARTLRSDAHEILPCPICFCIYDFLQPLGGNSCPRKWLGVFPSIVITLWVFLFFEVRTHQPWRSTLALNRQYWCTRIGATFIGVSTLENGVKVRRVPLVHKSLRGDQKGVTNRNCEN